MPKVYNANNTYSTTQASCATSAQCRAQVSTHSGVPYPCTCRPHASLFTVQVLFCCASGTATGHIRDRPTPHQPCPQGSAPVFLLWRHGLYWPKQIQGCLRLLPTSLHSACDCGQCDHDRELQEVHPRFPYSPWPDFPSTQVHHHDHSAPAEEQLWRIPRVCHRLSNPLPRRRTSLCHCKHRKVSKRQQLGAGKAVCRIG
mmetsp:Transcript_10431/g.17056  ORF Transcript_10431/g.17056 Transcript_10431/m.17056 type:complete len:200 (+) Transcript_10431:331-930(+)